MSQAHRTVVLGYDASWLLGDQASVSILTGIDLEAGVFDSSS
jgi:hypothetical protein